MELPLREIQFEIGESGEGVFQMATVNSPAIKKTYVYFNEQKPLKFHLADEEKRIVFAPALIPDMKVYRNIDGEEFNLTVSKDTIEKIAVDFCLNNRNTNVNIEHDGKMIGGVTMYQYLLTNENTVDKVKGFEELPIGTWFIGAKVNNDEVWQGIKDGKYNGWSIHAMFRSKQVSLSSMSDSELKAFLKLIF